jgi:hypothetical protein
MGASFGEFVKYPRTPHLFGSRGTEDDRHMGAGESELFIGEESLVVEEKVDGTNVGVHFTREGKVFLQCRGHEITTGMHPQYDLFKQWVYGKRADLEGMLEDRYILFGEWLYAKHSVRYLKLPHYFFEFDIYDKEAGKFLDLETRLMMLEGTGVQSAPVVHRGAIDREGLMELIGPSAFGSEFENPVTGMMDDLMEGVYLKTEGGGYVTGRAKVVRPEFVEKVKQSEHWQKQAVVPNQLIEGVEIW